MRILTTVFTLCILLALTNCGEEAIGFNIAKVVPLPFPVDLSGFDDPILNNTGLNPNPPGYTIGEDFKLEDVTSDIDLVDEIIVNGLAYKIEGVESNEDFRMDEFTISVRRPGGGIIAQKTIFSSNQPISNLPKYTFNSQEFSSSELTSALAAGETITATTTVDFAEVPDPIDFEFTFYFDVTAKIRQND